MRDLLEEQIIKDAMNGDTTVLASLLELISDKDIYNALSDVNQLKADEPKFICTNCGGGFTRDEMVFDKDDENDENDFCKNCK